MLLAFCSVLGASDCLAAIDEDLQRHGQWISPFNGSFFRLKKQTIFLYFIWIVAWSVNEVHCTHSMQGQCFCLSYPGILFSMDDFTLTSAGLSVIETTIGNSNADLWSHVRPSGCVLEGIRSMVANRMSSTGEQWTKIFRWIIKHMHWKSALFACGHAGLRAAFQFLQ